jgi:uncharacterized membrane protein YfhO
VSIHELSWPVRSQARLELAGAGGAVVGLKTLFQVGWSARQAGHELTVIRAAGAHLAVVVPDAAAGPVELQYRLPGLSLGLVASVAGWLGIGLVIVLGRRRS